MTATEIKEINERIAKLRSSQATGCEHCENGVIFKETASFGIVFAPCPHCSGERYGTNKPI